MAKKFYSSGLNHFESLGIELEDEMTSCFATFFQEKGDASSFVCTSKTELDTTQGTDALIYGVPCDFTYNLSGKDHTSRLPLSIALSAAKVSNYTKAIVDGIKVSFGVRTGNNYRGGTKFSQPVLVIGLDGIESDQFLGNYLQNIVDAIRASIEEIIELGQDQYWDYLDAHGLA